MPYYDEPLTLRGVIWVTASSHSSPPMEGHVEFMLHFPDRDHCTMHYSREDTPEAVLSLQADQLEATRQVVAMLLGPRAMLAPPDS